MIRLRMERLEPRLHLATYYISPSGNDGWNGLTPASAFQTMSRINALDLNAGDRVLFEGGKTFTIPWGPNPVNRVANSGFESGLADWSLNLDATPGNSTIASGANEKYEGAAGLRLGGTTDAGRGQVLKGMLPGRAYELWFRGRTVDTPRANSHVQVRFYRNGTLVAASQPTTFYGTEWRDNHLDVLAPGSFDRAEMIVRKIGNSSTAYVDSVRLFEKTPSVWLDSTDSGTPSNPVVIGSYGTGRAKLNAQNRGGIVGWNVSGLVIRDLDLVGNWQAVSGTGANAGTGIEIINSLPGNVRLPHIRIENVGVSGFKFGGISVESARDKSGFSDVLISNVTANANGDHGIYVRGEFWKGMTDWSHRNVRVEHCRVFDNPGVPKRGTNTGNGIVVADVDGALIQRNVVWNNGALNDVANGGPIGIWAWEANRVTIQHNESHSNKTGGNTPDGGGFDFDGGVTNSVMQYNYSHDNEGAGFLVWHFTNSRTINNNVIRYNISQNDARKNGYASIHLGGGSEVRNTHIYGNTVFFSKTSSSSAAAFKTNSVGPGNRVVNNIFVTTGGGRLLDIDSAYPASSLLFQGNNYWTSGGAFSIRWGSTWHSSLASFRNSGQEWWGTVPVGHTLDPRFQNPGAGGTVGNASNLESMNAYRLLPGSQLIDKGLSIQGVLGSSPGSRDYHGGSNLRGVSHDPGAAEYSW
jgi:hypothetical protein